MYRLIRGNKCLLVIGLCLISYLGKGQTNNPSFSQQELKGFEQQIIGDVRDFCYYLKDLASSDIKKENKPRIKTNILDLFINSATMEVLSVRQPKNPRTYPMNKYLDIVNNYDSRYKFVALQFYKVVVDAKNLKETVVDGKKAYVGTYSYWQRFLASNQDKESNDYTKDDFTKGGSDETKKVGTFYIIKEKSETDKWYVLLGDIKAKELKSI